MGPLVLALDLGTTTAKAALFDERGLIGSVLRRPLSLVFLPDGGVEQDPESILGAARRLLAVAISAVPPGANLAGVGIACQRSTIVVWERSTGGPIGPAVSWMDRRAAPLIRDLRADAREVIRRTGLRLSPHYGAAHLARRLRLEPSLARAARRGELAAGPVASFVLSRLGLGCPCACDPTLAQRTLLLDTRKSRWDPWLCDLFGIPPSCLPEIRPSAGDWGTITLAGSKVPVAVLAGDQQAAAAAFSLDSFSGRSQTIRRSGGGVGRSRGIVPGNATRSRARCALVHYGTGAFALWPHTGGQTHPGLLLSARADRPGALYLEGPVSTAGAALDSVARWIGRSRLREILADGGGHGTQPDEILASTAATRDLTERSLRDRLSPDDALLVPAFAGLAAPWWDDDAKAVLYGPRAADEPQDLVLAALAGIAHRITDVLEAAGATLSTRGPIVASGPLARVPALVGLQADLSGHPVRVAGESEGTLRGIARLAARSLGLWEMPPIVTGTPVSPRISRSERIALRASWTRALQASRGRG